MLPHTRHVSHQTRLALGRRKVWCFAGFGKFHGFALGRDDGTTQASSGARGTVQVLASHQTHLAPDTSRTGRLAGVRSRVYTEVWRDKVILEALRIYRARTEGASLDTVPEVTFSLKPSCDGRADKSVAQRGIMGFEPRSARRG